METYKFETTVSENGIIQIPEISQLANRPIEIFIVVKQPDSIARSNTSQSIDQFLNKWTGFMREKDPDNNKLKYLQEKYA